MANRRRGEVPLDLGGRRYTLCLTLGALADLEDSLRAGDLAGLAERLVADVRHLPLAGSMEALVTALGEVLEAAFGPEDPENPPRPRGDERGT